MAEKSGGWVTAAMCAGIWGTVGMSSLMSELVDLLLSEERVGPRMGDGGGVLPVRMVRDSISYGEDMDMDLEYSSSSASERGKGGSGGLVGGDVSSPTRVEVDDVLEVRFRVAVEGFAVGTETFGRGLFAS